MAYRREKCVYWTPETAKKTSGLNAEVEFLCDIGASELLMPRAEFAAQMAERPFCLTTILGLAELFGASIEAATIRVMEQTTVPAAVVFCHLALKPSEQKKTTPRGKPSPKLRVRRAYCSPAFQGFIPSHCSVPRRTARFRKRSAAMMSSMVTGWSASAAATTLPGL